MVRGRETKKEDVRKVEVCRHPSAPREAVPERRRRLFVLGEDERVLETPFRLDRDVLQFPDAVAPQLRPPLEVPRPPLELPPNQMARRTLPDVALEAACAESI